MENYQSYTLKNGIRIIHKPTDSKVSYCGFIVNTGTRDENEDEYGIAHFVEHMLFKGTEKRKSHHIVNRMELVGGEINAYTNKEETVIYSVFLEEHFNRAFELISDLFFHSTFPEKEVEKEIEVILDEINSYEDSPSELIFDDFENLIFKDTQLGHNILGYTETLENINGEKGRKFVKNHYQTNNIVFFSLGKTNFKKVIQASEKYLSDLPYTPTEYNRTPPTLLHSPIKTIIEKDTTQAHVVIGGRSYSLHESKRKSLYLLNNILGGPGMNSRLNISLREKKGYVYNVDSSITSYSDTGIFTIYFGSDKKNVDKCISLIEKEIKKFREIKLSTFQLAAAKKQLIGQMVISNNNHENLALSLGKSFLHYNHFNSTSELIEKIEKISSTDIRDVANEILNEKLLNYLTFN